MMLLLKVSSIRTFQLVHVVKPTTSLNYISLCALYRSRINLWITLNYPALFLLFLWVKLFSFVSV